MANYLVFALCMFGAWLIGYGCACSWELKPAKRSPIPSWPLPQVLFDPISTDEERLKFLEMATQAVRDGRLRQADELQDQRASNQAAKPVGGRDE